MLLDDLRAVDRPAPERLPPDLALVDRLAVDLRLVDRAAPDRLAPDRVPERLEAERLVERPRDVALLAVLFARLVAPLARFEAVRVVRLAAVLAPLARLLAPLAVLFAVARAPPARLRAVDASACARLPAAFAADLTVLPAALTARLAAGLAERRVEPDAADFTAVRAERTAVLPLFTAALRCRVAAAFLAAAERCAFV